MHSRTTTRRSLSPVFALALALLLVFALVGAQVRTQILMAPGTALAAGAEAATARGKSVRAQEKNGNRNATTVQNGPGWETLNTPQKLALYPLAERWAFISEVQKRRWLALTTSFALLSPEEQAKFHERMTGWASLSAQQRNQARLNFATTNRLAPDDKKAQWEAYQALSEAEKRDLAARAAPKPKGAATALRPVSPKKLAQVPAAAQANPNRANTPKILPPSAPMVQSAPSHTPASAPPAPEQAPVVQEVQTSPVSLPTAVSTPLPPLEPLSSTEPVHAAPTAHPHGDHSKLYPQ